MPKLPKRLSRNTIYESDWLNLYADKVEMPDKSIIEKYHIIEWVRTGAMALITDDEGKILMVNSPRYPTQKSEWELPAGAIELKEKNTEGLAREILEETGYSVKDLKKVYEIDPVSGSSPAKMHLFTGKLKKQETENFDKAEVAQVRWFTQEKLLELILLKKIHDAPTLCLLMLFLSDVLHDEE